jgi:hypothetical protein
LQRHSFPALRLPSELHRRKIAPFCDIVASSRFNVIPCHLIFEREWRMTNPLCAASGADCRKMFTICADVEPFRGDPSFPRAVVGLSCDDMSPE